ncbi:MAG TPA: WD40 repeat domain-containing protein, partial [Candidatus Binatia bacterium]|nr:WD40 repeat domain-containing protein [Candidatus Binatia bacterium]
HRALSAQKQETVLRRQAEQERARAETEKAAARLNEYIADINLAEQSLKDGNYGRAVQLLKKHQPAAGEPDLRGFEWRHLWHQAQGDEHIALPKQTHDVRAVAISPQGDFIVVGGLEQFSVYNARTHALIKTLAKGGLSMAFLPDGTGLITASQRTARIWDTTDWSEKKSWPNDFGSIALSPDGKRLAGIGRNSVRITDVKSGENVRVIEKASGPLVFSWDGKTLVTDAGAGITLWPLEENHPEIVLANSTNLFRRTPIGPPADRAFTFSPDNRFVIAARNVLSEKGVFVLGIWDATTGKEIGQMPEASEPEHTGVISSIAFSPDGKLLATASMDHSIRLWDFASRKRIAALHGHLSEVWSLAFSPDSKMVVSGSKDGSVNIWETHRTQKEDVLAGWTPLSFSRDSGKLAALNREGVVAFLNLATGEPEQQFQLDVPRFNAPRAPRPRISVVLSDDLRTIAQNVENGVKLWNTETGDSIVLKASERRIDSLELSPDGRELITASGWERGAARWWDVGAGTNFVITTEAFRFWFSPDGRMLIGIGRSNSVELWDVATRSLRTNWVVDPQPGFLSPVAFSPNGRTVALGGSDDVIRLYELATGKLSGAFIGHKQNVFSLAFSPDGRTLASAGDDSTLRLWNVATQQELLVDRRLGGALREVMFSPDGQLLAAGSSMSFQSGGIRFYRAPRPGNIQLT